MKWIGLLALSWMLAAPVALAQDDDESMIEVEPDPGPETDAEKKKEKKPEPWVPARQPGAEVETATLRSADGKFRIDLPADWKLVENKAESPLDAWFHVYLPGVEAKCVLQLRDYHTLLSPRGGPVYIRRETKRENRANVVLGAQPHPHVSGERRVGNETWTELSIFVRSRGRTTQIIFDAPRKHMKPWSDELLAAAGTLVNQRPEWPAIPKGYKVKRAGAFRVAVHPSVKGSVAHIIKTLTKLQKITDGLFGKFPKPTRDEPAPVLYIHSDKQQEGKLVPRVGKTTTGSSLCLSALCIFVQYYPKDSRKEPIDLAGTVGEFNVIARYGTEAPMWMRCGESYVVESKFSSGKRLPTLARGFRNWLDELPPGRLDTLTTQVSKDDWPFYYKNALFYVATFRAGPRKCRKAYKAFLKDMRDNLDPEAAVRRRIAPLGYDELKQAASDFMTRRVVIAKPSK